MSKSIVAFHEVSFEVAARLEARHAHRPTEMRSGQSHGPIKMWVCDMPRCGEIKYTYTTPHAPPTCHGGLLFSFKTSGAEFDPMVHHERARFT